MCIVFGVQTCGNALFDTLQGHRSSPKKGRVIRSSASLSSGSGFTRLTSGLTTIVSPPKLR